jgi:hypothetical protein
VSVCVCVSAHTKTTRLQHAHMYTKSAPFDCGWGRVYNRFWKKKYMYIKHNNICVYIMLYVVHKLCTGTKMEKITHPEMKYENYSGPVFIFFFLNLYLYNILTVRATLNERTLYIKKKKIIIRGIPPEKRRL